MTAGRRQSSSHLWCNPRERRIGGSQEAVHDKYNLAAWRYTTQRENGIEGTVVEAYAEDMLGNVTKGEGGALGQR